MVFGFLTADTIGQYSDCAVVAVLPLKKTFHVCHEAGYLALLDTQTGDEAYDYGPRRIYPSEVNFEMVQRCMLFCKQKHKKTCSSSSSSVSKINQSN